ncbi:hypothetical protein GUITHDRAFT_120198 [Guillardia theta CCMP2712]|uniref:Uncharacterized protein n=1 Tax=Guillardia theta (strain CCMP2712) TaxID=905079 RepID=L1ICF4_GUITC|nr:hypothetical protein GUITHDRAFT_120198 [Guillardia theta CCMP2712]EKX33609.1 hypothetical protein GUITHDRAFT_120198 [Guillardia theta CCMP2712]|eukprot:XP_005820589.1 hypothetical protein GUITHDRAFT_120198 [Guillardia theta CCMP2712]
MVVLTDPNLLDPRHYESTETTCANSMSMSMSMSMRPVTKVFFPPRRESDRMMVVQVWFKKHCRVTCGFRKRSTTTPDPPSPASPTTFPCPPLPVLLAAGDRGVVM